MKYLKGRRLIISISVIVLVFIVLAVFEPTSLLMIPQITPTEYVATKPYMQIGDIIIIVPSSTIIVYFLGFQILYLGYKFLKEDFPLWGISLLFWGLGTLLAGTSYQGLGYQLKCVGVEYCQFTSWFELAYLFITALSISIMGLAFSKLFLYTDKKKWLEGYVKFAIVLYAFILVLGSIIENRLMISYEMFTVFFMPLFVVFFIINLKNYMKSRDQLNQSFIVLWILFLIVNVSYYLYYIPQITESLYGTYGIWFSANDVLHIGLILWFGFFQFSVRKTMVKLKEKIG